MEERERDRLEWKGDRTGMGEREWNGREGTCSGDSSMDGIQLTMQILSVSLCTVLFLFAGQSPCDGSALAAMSGRVTFPRQQ